MKKIMILGGGINQIGLVNASKDCGYYVILCDNNPNCYARDRANLFLNINIIDDDTLYRVGKINRIDGIISNSEVAMETVAIVSERLGLVGNPSMSIAALQSKHDFRENQRELGLFAPKNCILSENDNMEEVLANFTFPIVVKPVKCSGTRGTTRFDRLDVNEISKVVKECIAYSRDRQCSVEEFVEMPSYTVLEGDVFVVNDQFFWGGLFFTQRSEKLPMVPMTYMSPYIDTTERMTVIYSDLQKVFNGMGICHGEYNIEAYFDAEGNFFIIEINARQGGHGLPAYIKLATGVDMDKMLVTTAVGDNQYFDQIIASNPRQKYAVRHTVFSNVDGIYEGIHIANTIKPYVIQVEEEKKPGDFVEKRKNGSSHCGFVNLVFDDYSSQHTFSAKIEDYIYPLIKE